MELEHRERERERRGGREGGREGESERERERERAMEFSHGKRDAPQPCRESAHGKCVCVFGVCVRLYT